MAIALTSDRLTLVLQPETGGSVVAFRLAGDNGPFDLMRTATGPRALDSGMFPMVPFANCIRDNRFGFGGREYRVSPNMAGVELNFHGSGWLSEWSVAARTPTTVDLVLEEGRIDGAYRYRATQRFELDGEGLSVWLAVENLGADAMPFTFGLHPWFPRHGTARVRFHSDGWWRGDESGRTIAHVPFADGGDYATGKEPPLDWQNVCHTGWNGVAEIDWPGAGTGLRIVSAPVFTHLMVHVPMTGEAVFCLEPQSNAPCAFDGLDTGRVATGVHVLGPREEIGCRTRFIPVQATHR